MVGTFCVAKGMSVTLLQKTTSTDFWIFQLVGTVCVTKATFVTLSLKSISQRQDNHGLPRANRSPRTVTKCRTREKGDNSDRWQHEDVFDSSISHTAPVPGGVARHNLVSLLPSSIPEPRMWETNGGEDSSSSQAAAASMSSSAGRLRHEPFDERSAWKFPPGGSSPHWRPNSALFFKSGKSAKKNTLKRHICKACFQRTYCSSTSSCDPK